ncbi:hypothetical protein [Globicatella sulfidifaciens]|uniref:Uncharacterized protein n=1 Tax=Globicatella sulfidifaciens TaxID=136093 RepID=A0A7X8H1A3_9LACT|nr:hypothetical protein [Globicatella sulfidifaciens]NLJ19422.1 hypothetical protein [Globicatella sulfidifaciens]
MELEYSRGFVTFADILGWKGIWQTNNHQNPVNTLIEIKDTITESISLMSKRYFEHLLNTELKKYIDNDLKKEMLDYIFRRNLNINESINKTFKSKEDLEKFKVVVSSFLVEIKVDLISDTFIITSTSKNKRHEFYMHMSICQRLLLECLKQGLLIRGATSYGDYYNKELVFIGPAIDDSASWHEMGEEIGIFLTPKAMLMINSNDFESVELAIGDINILDIVTSGEPKLKVNTFKTFLVDWYNGKEYFYSIISKYPTILPEIHKKILFSNSRLDFFQNLRKGKDAE